MQTNLSSDIRGLTTGTINQGVVRAGKFVELGIAAQLPVNARSGKTVGVLGLIHLFVDDLFPNSIGGPILYQTIMHIMNLRTAAVLIVLASLLVFPGVSHGHAFPEHFIPRVGGETLSTPPVGAYIWFDGDIEPAFSRITVQDMSRKQVDQGKSRVDPSNSVLLEVGLPVLPAGAYRVIWNVVASDGPRTDPGLSETAHS